MRTVGLPLLPPQGLPVYISHFRKELLDKMPQPDTVDQARAAVRENAMAGTRATKLFLATPQGNRTTKRMSIDIARAAVEETHRRGQLVYGFNIGQPRLTLIAKTGDNGRQLLTHVGDQNAGTTESR